MTDKHRNLDAEYRSLKAQYDALLDKNQNDLIAIRHKEKHLAEELQRLRGEKEEGEREARERERALREELGRKKEGELCVTVNEEGGRIRELEMDVRSLMDQNIALTAENTALRHEQGAVGQLAEGVTEENRRLKERIASLQTQLRTESARKQVKESFSQTQPFRSPQQATLRQQLRACQEHLQQLGSRLRQCQQQGRGWCERERKAMQLLKRREGQLSAAQGQLQRARGVGRKRKTESGEGCGRCHQLQQQVGLLKQMVKSTKGMARVRQLEAQRQRLHEEGLRENRSVGRQPSTLPPLRKG